MRCPLIILGLAAAFTLVASPAVRRVVFYRDQPPTPADWSPKYREYRNGKITRREWSDAIIQEGRPA